MDPKRGSSYDNRARTYYYQGDYQQAIADYSKAIELDPKNAINYYNRGLAYHNQGDYQQAIADYAKAIELNPKYVKAYAKRGKFYLNQRNYQQAIADFTRAIELDPKNVTVYADRGLAYYYQGNYQHSIADYEKAIKLDPKDVGAWINLCWTAGRAGVTAGIVDACGRAIKQAPDNGWMYEGRGLARALTGDYQGAIEDFKFFVQWSKQNNLYEQYGHKREAWIAALEAGRNPFDEATLEELRKE